MGERSDATTPPVGERAQADQWCATGADQHGQHHRQGEPPSSCEVAWRRRRGSVGATRPGSVSRRSRATSALSADGGRDIGGTRPATVDRPPGRRHSGRLGGTRRGGAPGRNFPPGPPPSPSRASATSAPRPRGSERHRARPRTSRVAWPGSFSGYDARPSPKAGSTVTALGTVSRRAPPDSRSRVPCPAETMPA